MYSIRKLGLISVLACAVLSQAQQLTTVTATPAEVKPAVTDLPVSGNTICESNSGKLNQTLAGSIRRRWR